MCCCYYYESDTKWSWKDWYYKVMANDILTVPFSLAGLSATSTPITIHNIDKQTNNGIHVCGMQIVGSRLDEYNFIFVFFEWQ